MRALSFLSPAEVQMLGGLPAEAVIGQFIGDEEDAPLESFRANPVFRSFLHDTIQLWGPADPELQQAARDQGDGWIYIIDGRTPDGPQGRVPPEDIIGAFEVAAGEIVATSYQPSPAHRLLTGDGVCQPPPALRAALIRRLRTVS